MELLGATVDPGHRRVATLKDAINEALRDWVANVENTHYLLGTAAGAHPFPALVRYFHEVIGEEARAQILDQTGRLPDAVCACIGGGSNAIGIFHGFLDDRPWRCTASRPAARAWTPAAHAATITLGRPGVLHGARSYLMQDEDGQTIESHSISAGLDYPGVGPSTPTSRTSAGPVRAGHRHRGHGRVPAAVPDRGHHPRHRVSHALAGALRVAKRAARRHPQETIIVVNLSGRGDKDVATAAEWFDLCREISRGRIGSEGEQL